MIESFTQHSVDTYMMNEFQKSDFIRQINRDLAAKLGQHLLQENLVYIRQHEEPNEHTLLTTFTASVVTATRGEMKRMELLEGFIEHYELEKAFEDYSEMKRSQKDYFVQLTRRNGD